ncbi:hypothetical protein JCM10213_002303 [Rhodosporidiobolus nylandii]
MPSLLDLPPELIDEIADLVHATHPKQYLGAAHRTFLPASRRLFFRLLVATSFVRLDRLCDLLRQGEAVAQSVARLELDLAGVDPGLPSSADVAALLESLPSLRVLEVRDSPRILDIATSPLSSKPNLEQLCLDFPPNTQFSPFHLDRFRRLATYTNLYTLSICAESDGTPPPQIHPPPAPLSLNVVHLRLEGWLLDDPAVPLLIAACPHLDALALGHHDGTQDGLGLPFDHLLDAVASTALRRLDLSDTGDYRHTELSSAIERFTELECLGLRLSCAAAELLASLHKFPLLSTVVFHPGVDIATDGILLLLKPTTKPPSLRALKVDKIDPVLAQQNMNIAYDWSPSFSKSGVAALLAAADEVGVEMSGYCVEVVKAEQAAEAAAASTKESRKAGREAAKNAVVKT